MHSCTSWCGTASRLLKGYISIWKDMLQEVLQMPLRLSQNLVVINKSACSRGEIYSRKKNSRRKLQFLRQQKDPAVFCQHFCNNIWIHHAAQARVRQLRVKLMVMCAHLTGVSAELLKRGRAESWRRRSRGLYFNFLFFPYHQKLLVLLRLERWVKLPR